MRVGEAWWVLNLIGITAFLGIINQSINQSMVLNLIGITAFLGMPSTSESSDTDPLSIRDPPAGMMGGGISGGCAVEKVAGEERWAVEKVAGVVGGGEGCG